MNVGSSSCDGSSPDRFRQLPLDVFEHVEDYIGFLRKLRGRAQAYVFHIPLDLDIRGLLRKRHLRERRTVGHLHYFDRDTAIATLEHTGYAILDSFYTTKPDPHLKAKLVLAARRVVRALVTEHLAVRLLGGSSLLVLAR